MLFLRFESGPRAGEKVPLDKNRITFGRHSSCDCVLQSRTVSRQHFCIERVGGKYLLVDQGSGNGTFVNGERVGSWVELKAGHKIQAGPFAFTLVLSEAQEAPDLKSSLAADAKSNDEQTESLDESQSRPDAEHRRAYPREYIEGIEHFNAGRYFEAHEVWEEIWLRSSGDAKVFYQMLIQAAVGLHHYERGNHRGARGMHKAVTEKLLRLPQVFMSLDLADFSSQFKSFFADLIENGNETAPPADKIRPFIELLKDDYNGFGAI